MIILSWLYNNNWLFRLFHLLLIIRLMHTADTGFIYGEVLLDANWIRICFPTSGEFFTYYDYSSDVVKPAFLQTIHP